MPAVSAYAGIAMERLRSAFEPLRQPDRATGMAAYMRGQFPFLGIQTAERRSVAKSALAAMDLPAETDLIDLSAALYEEPEREYQYVAVDFVEAHVKRCSAGFLNHARVLVTTKSWWDTVDGIAASVVGPLVMANPSLANEMDRWIEDENLWVARTALLHQLRYKRQTDANRLFRYCEFRAGDREFFIRKAIGWALREYSKTDPEAVQGFIEGHGEDLSGLSKREGMLWITGRKKRPAFP
jgi:3-methyladenine DNA glycosylase AlkD